LSGGPTANGWQINYHQALKVQGTKVSFYDVLDAGYQSDKATSLHDVFGQAIETSCFGKIHAAPT